MLPDFLADVERMMVLSLTLNQTIVKPWDEKKVHIFDSIHNNNLNTEIIK